VKTNRLSDDYRRNILESRLQQLEAEFVANEVTLTLSKASPGPNVEAETSSAKAACERLDAQHAALEKLLAAIPAPKP